MIPFVSSDKEPINVTLVLDHGLRFLSFIDISDNIYDNYHFTNNSPSNIEIKNGDIYENRVLHAGLQSQSI